MAYMFFISWGMFPLLFLMGPEGFKHINASWSTILHSVADLFSKNLWGFYAWYLRIQVREYHRKKWFEEQERLKAGEAEFEVEKERRPDVTMDTVNTVLAVGVADEEEVDPYYAEYRRQRRRNRGRSLSEPEPGLLGMGKSQPKQEFILQSPPVQPGQMTMQMNQMPVMQQQMGVMNNTMNPLGSMNQLSNMNQPQVNNMSNMNQQQMGGIQTTGSIVIVADNTGFQSGSFFVTKLQTELGAQVIPVPSKEELMGKLTQCQNTGTKVDAVFVHDGLMQQYEAFNLTSQFKVAFVQYGMNPQPASMFGEAYLQVPKPGQPYNNSELFMLFNKLRTQNLGGQPLQQQMSTGGGMGGMMGGDLGVSQSHTPQASPGAADSSSAGASVDVLMAEMNALKQYLNTNSGPGGM